jgi:hypothetical protein
VVARQGAVPADRRARRGQAVGQRLQLGAVRQLERRVRLAGRPKLVLHSKVQLGRAGAEPGATTRGKLGRLGYLGHAEQITGEPSQLRFGTGRAGQLHVVDRPAHAGRRPTTKIRRNGSTVPYDRAG